MKRKRYAMTKAEKSAIHDAWIDGPKAWKSAANLCGLWGDEWYYAMQQTWAKWQRLG